jgi:hypothetical protein
VLDLADAVACKESIDVLIAISLLHALDINPQAFGRLMGIEIPGADAYFNVLVKGFQDLKVRSGKEIMVVIENRGQREENLDTERVLRQTRLKFQAAGIPVFATPTNALIGLSNALIAHRQLCP